MAKIEGADGGWVTIAPRSGPDRSATVSVGWAPRSGRSWTLDIRIGSTLLSSSLGWPYRAKLQADYHPSTNQVRLFLRANKKVGWAVIKTNSGGQVRLPLPHDLPPRRHYVQVCPHAIREGALLITLPDWAMPESVKLAREATLKIRQQMAA